MKVLQVLRHAAYLLPVALLAPACFSQGEGAARATTAKLVPVGGIGWAKTSINAAIFRTSSLVTHGDTQYIGYYDGDGNVVLGKRKVGADKWELHKTQYTGQAKDAHNVISLGIDGKGILHMVWDLHNQNVRYAQSLAPDSLELGPEQKMTGDKEVKVTYPQFYSQPNGDLVFMYREGSSGDGDVMLNRYDVKTGQWKVVKHPLIDGEGKRNAYVNGIAVDAKGGWHISWCWRESPDVASNHDVCYAFSPDEGETWQKTTGEKYSLPITAANAEVACPVPQNSELINQTSMAVDAAGHPIISTYWRDQNSEVPQFRILWHDGTKWQQSQVGTRTQGFRLSGGGTKRIPISRPLVIAGKNNAIYVIYRDEERGNGVTLAASTDAAHTQWTLSDIVQERMGAWEPAYDPNLWLRDGKLDLFIQRVGQGDAETLENVQPQEIYVAEWTP